MDDTAADDFDQGEHLFRLPGSDLKRESDVDRLWTAAVKFYDEILKKRNVRFDKATTPAVAKLLHKYLHELHELMRDSRSDAMIDAMTTFIRRHQPSTSMPYAARLEVTADEGAQQAGNKAPAKDEKIVAQAKDAWKDASDAAGLNDVLRHPPLQGQEFRFHRAAILTCCPQSDSMGMIQFKLNEQLRVKIISRDDEPYLREGYAHGQAATRGLRGQGRHAEIRSALCKRDGGRSDGLDLDSDVYLKMADLRKGNCDHMVEEEAAHSSRARRRSAKCSSR